MVKKLHKASAGYSSWKKLNNPKFKPWHFPEQISSPRIQIEDVSFEKLFLIEYFRTHNSTKIFKHSISKMLQDLSRVNGRKL